MAIAQFLRRGNRAQFHQPKVLEPLLKGDDRIYSDRCQCAYQEKTKGYLPC